MQKQIGYYCLQNKFLKTQTKFQIFIWYNCNNIQLLNSHILRASFWGNGYSYWFQNVDCNSSSLRGGVDKYATKTGIRRTATESEMVSWQG